MPPNTLALDPHDKTLDVDSLQLLARPDSVRFARRLVRDRLPRWDLDHLIDEVTLIVSEFVTNAVAASAPSSSSDTDPDDPMAGESRWAADASAAEGPGTVENQPEPVDAAGGQEIGEPEASGGYAALYDDTPPILAVRVRLTGAFLFAEVADISAVKPRPRAAGDCDEDGRGLQLVDYVADYWGWYATDRGGKVVYAAWRLDRVSVPPQPVAVGA